MSNENEERAITCGRMFIKATHDAAQIGMPWPALIDGLSRALASVSISLHGDHQAVARYLRELADRLDQEAEQKEAKLQ